MWIGLWVTARRIKCTLCFNTSYSLWRYTWTGKTFILSLFVIYVIRFSLQDFHVFSSVLWPWRTVQDRRTGTWHELHLPRGFCWPRVLQSRNSHPITYFESQIPWKNHITSWKPWVKADYSSLRLLWYFVSWYFTFLIVQHVFFFFADECQNKYGNANAWRYCCQLFDLLTVAAVS